MCFSSYGASICAAGQSLVHAPPPGGAPSSCGPTYLNKPVRGDIGGNITIILINYYDWKMLIYFQVNKILYILDTTILILYRKLYINIVSIIVLNIEVRQYKIKINLAISCSTIYTTRPFSLQINHHCYHRWFKEI